MINFSVGMRPNPMSPEEPKKAYAYVQARETMDINKFAEHIANHGCVYGRADIAAVLTMAVDCIRENLLNGNLIKLGDLGTFSIALQSSPADSIADFKSEVNIIGVSAKWTPGNRFANMLADATFQNVPPRSFMRKLMKSIKTGDLVVDFSENNNDDTPEENEPSSGIPDSGNTGGNGSTEDDDSMGD